MELNNSKIKIKAKNLNVYYGKKQALFDINLDINQKEVTALIGPSGCGKSTFIRCINRMNDVIDICKVEGSVEIDGAEINEKNVDVVTLREKVGMVFQKPNPFPKSIYDNIAYGPIIHGAAENKDQMDKIVETSLKKATSYGFPSGHAQSSGFFATFIHETFKIFKFFLEKNGFKNCNHECGKTR